MNPRTQLLRQAMAATGGLLRRTRPALARSFQLLGDLATRLHAVSTQIISRTTSRLSRGWARWAGSVRSVARTLVLGGAVGALLALATQSLVHEIHPGRIGVRQVSWSGAGLEQQDHAAGLHTGVAVFEEWHELRAGTHMIQFGGGLEGASHQALELATREGELCQLDVLVTYRIQPGQAWRLVADGLRVDYPVRAVAACRRVLLEEFGNASALSFADPSACLAMEERALARLQEALGEVHLLPTSVRIGNVFFDETYEKKMLEGQLASQGSKTQATLQRRAAEQRINDAQALELADARSALVKEFALAAEARERAAAERMQDFEVEVRRAREERLAQLELEVLALTHEGEVALAAAADLRDQLFDAALEGPEGKLYIARQAAANLRFGEILLDAADERVPNLLDLDGLVELLVGEGL